MSDLEQALAYEQELMMEMEELKEELVEVRELISSLSAEESDNPHWTAPQGELGARLNTDIAAIHDTLLQGNRAEVYWANSNPIFHYAGILASLTEEISPEYRAHYVKAQTKYFGAAIAGLTFTMAEVYDPETGVQMEGYVIPWWGNHGPYKATMKLQEDWASPLKLSRVRGQAEREMKRLDRRFFWYKVTGREDEFMEKYPNYVPE